jgi:hypothetical protein
MECMVLLGIRDMEAIEHLENIGPGEGHGAHGARGARKDMEGMGTLEVGPAGAQ